MNCYSPNFQGFILMKNAINNQVGMFGDMFLWLVANLKQGVIYFIKQPPKQISRECTHLFNRLIFIVWKHDFIASEMLVSCSERMLGIKFILQKTSFRFNISIVQPFNAVILVFVMSVYKLSWPMSRRSENSGGLLHQL